MSLIIGLTDKWGGTKSVRITERSHFFGTFNKNKTDPMFYRENNGRRNAKGRDNTDIPCIVLEKK